MVLIHVSKQKIHKPKSIKQIDKSIKPNGLWYAPNIIWLNYMTNVLKKKIPKYTYIIKLNYTDLNNKDKNKVLQIKNIDDFDNFTFKYGYMHKTTVGTHIMIHWEKVEHDFAGVEVIPFIKERTYLVNENAIKKYNKNGFKLKSNSYMQLTWLYGWDVDSGVVWNEKAIELFTQISTK